MKRTTLRAAGISALVAIALGVAAPAATAATEAPARTVSIAQTTDAQQATRSLSLSTAGSTAASGLSGSTGGAAINSANGEVRAQGVGALIKAAWEAIKKAGLAKKAFNAAKKGQTGFTKWVDSLSNFNPAKWAIKALPGYAVQELITYILNNYTG
ncbi:hypothetical protein ACIQV1_29125 [Streptomyces rubiginosohelvolus]|uniref:hypothetical protein n=1 Tax=Streptomyces rubiginosohelvolus TaxID=67362 RepID=UPI00339FF277